MSITAAVALSLVAGMASGGCRDQQGQAVDIRNVTDQVRGTEERIALVLHAVCLLRCDNNYRSCIEYSIIAGLEERLPGPSRGPARRELPGCWPYECSDDESQALAKTNPTLSCSQLEQRCVQACN